MKVHNNECIIPSNGTMKKKIDVPASKSYANRALILAAISRENFKLFRVPKSLDVLFLMESLKKLGLMISEGPPSTDSLSPLQNYHFFSLSFLNSFPSCEEKSLGETIFLNVGEGGTTARFLAAMCLMGQKTYVLKLGKRLALRPWNEFLKIAQSLGAKAELQGSHLILKGPMFLPPRLEVDCSRTTQFATAFQLLAGINPSFKVIPTNLESSQSYWKITLWLIDEFQKKTSFEIPRDWSSASYALAFGAINHDISFPYLKDDVLQSDFKFVQILRKLKRIEVDDNMYHVFPSNVEDSLQIDVSDCLDLVPTLGFFLSHINGIHELYGVKNLQYKESERLTETLKLVCQFGREAFTLNENTMMIKGDSHLQIKNKIQLKMPHDHRMVMTGILFLLQHGGGTIRPIDAINKSYPHFLELINTVS